MQQHSLLAQPRLVRDDYERRLERLSARHRFQATERGPRYLGIVWTRIRRGSRPEHGPAEPRPVV